MTYEDYPEEFNNNNHDPDDHSMLHGIFLPIAYSITCVLGLIGNVLIIIVFVFYEKIKTLTDTFLINLAVADILFLTTLPFLAYESAHSWVFGNFLCKMLRSTYRVNLYTSMLTLTAITFDRFISITKVTKANKYQVTKQNWRCVVCASLWVLALGLSIPQFIYNRVSEHHHCYEIFDPPIMELVLVSIQMAVGFILPLTSMIFCYSFILRTLVNAQGVQKKKSMKIILAIVVVFIATQLPHNALVLALALKKDFHSNTFFVRVSIIMEAVAYVHACLNPVLYFFVGTKFRKHFWKILRGLGLNRTLEETTDHLQGTDGDSKNVSASTNLFVTSV
ncbi:C-X-C chemokine receptor type 6 [Bufo gargarizans]|uniref:C-X-C chemokine receptor type 6 n=1 Tax=Bufo gargarizans TaxID=30331 RepID=UPI001CF4DC75|nr:C-X-C chemokine receptor type 6 [Bufo gargarizans]XP_044129500.1 C-X-C chemokine receptor type 6 [Bufo gargarizans]